MPHITSVSCNGLLAVLHQAITWNNADLLQIKINWTNIETNFIGIWMFRPQCIREILYENVFPSTRPTNDDGIWSHNKVSWSFNYLNIIESTKCPDRQYMHLNVNQQFSFLPLPVFTKKYHLPQKSVYNVCDLSQDFSQPFMAWF